MRIGLGLPITDPHLLTDWARRGESAGFDTLALLDRLAYHNPEPLVALSVLAGATSRIRLQTEVLLGPLRSTALLAKQVATLDIMSGGRFTLGIGVGGREDDHAAAGTPVTARGRLLETQLTELRRIWRGEPYQDAVVGPRPATPAGPPILIGAFAPAALRRIARHGAGFLCAAPLPWADKLVSTVQHEWTAAGRSGRPRLVCQINVALGTAFGPARSSIAAYYGRDDWGVPIADPAELVDTVAAYRAFGADELILYCYADDPTQVDHLARVLGRT
ncbi:LLM class flavin-dependent oxidoreductase [Paractinoplanes ferrugineus]|uniref:Luciferase n=1 Tax=Paractinoplanes ferrugineus TaxID=113564 RepID=A0A919J3N6_9ACTN|nr:LLM class flavin-dependent oxidoreductase [Actinoplanes ferrugineus]GIE13355.1 luciferase [Actinoplanes ferrugineus]